LFSGPAGHRDIRACQHAQVRQPSTDVQIDARRVIEVQTQKLEHSAPHGHEGQTRKRFYASFRSALQTHLQGVDGATPGVVIETCRHDAALLSRLNDVTHRQ
jgi:hypothetical protein